MMFKYLTALLFLALATNQVSAESNIDKKIDSLADIIDRAPAVIDLILDEAKDLNHKFTRQFLTSFLQDLKDFRTALRKVEDDAEKPDQTNSLFVIQNFTNLFQVVYKSLQSMKNTNYTEGLDAIKQSIQHIKEKIDDPNKNFK